MLLFQSLQILKVLVVCVHRAVLQRRWRHLERAFLSSTERRLPRGGDGGADVGWEVQLEPVRHAAADMTYTHITKLFPCFLDVKMQIFLAGQMLVVEKTSNVLVVDEVCSVVFSFYFALCLLLFVSALLQRLQFEHELAAWRRWASVLQTGTPAGEKQKLCL